jgi:hypothetical protein
MIRRSLVLLGALLLILAIAAPAVADAPVVVEEWDDEFEGLSQLTEVCGFNVYVSGHETGIVKMFVDSNGDPTHFTYHINGAATLSTDEGVTGFDRWAQTIVDDVANDRVIFRGNSFNTHVPGSGTGIVVNDSGHITITAAGITINGPADTWGTWDEANQRLCDALSS